MKISIVVSDVSTNCIGRGYILAKVLSPHFDVEFVGPMLIGSQVWPPFDTNEFECKFIDARNYPFFLKTIPLILRKITGDVIYALKPLASSYGLALLSRLSKNRPIVLDIDDWEVGFVKWRLSISKLSWFRLYDVNWIGWTYLLDRFTEIADKITVSNQFLANRYGGTLIPHGRDGKFLEPTLYDTRTLKSNLGFCREKLVLFLGSPEPYKGLEDLIDAVQLLDRKDVKILMVGADEKHPFIHKLMAKSQELLKVIGPRPLTERPKWLSVADVVVIPQRHSMATIGQMPAKIFDAMAMGKPIVATNVSDIPTVLQDCGLVVSAGDVKALAQGINYVLEYPAQALEMGKRARDKFITYYSWEAIEKPLLDLFSPYHS